MQGKDQAGCAQCWPAEAEAAARAVRATKIRLTLADESHFIFAIRCCEKCAQQFLFCFTEIIDWSAGDDAQYVTYLPLSDAEAQEMQGWTEGPDRNRLRLIAAGRRCLQVDHPTGQPQRVRWNTGFFIGPHD